MVNIYLNLAEEILSTNLKKKKNFKFYAGFLLSDNWFWISDFFGKFRVLEVNIMLNLHSHFFYYTEFGQHNIPCIFAMAWE